MYASGVGAPIDADEAKKWFRKAADQGLKEAQVELDNIKKTDRERQLAEHQKELAQKQAALETAEKERKLAERERQIAEKRAADEQAEKERQLHSTMPTVLSQPSASSSSSGATAQCDILAGNPRDQAKAMPGIDYEKIESSSAISACRSAVEHDKNNPRLWYEFGRALMTKGQYAEAVEYLRKAAERDYTAAFVHLGSAYDNGWGVPKDLKVAVDLYRRAAERGNADGQRNLGLAYLAGTGVPKDEKLAVDWIMKAATQGYDAAQTSVGLLYHNGTGVTQDDGIAVEWYRKAADQRFAWGQYNLGLMYLNGLGVTQDRTEAVNLFRKAADQGNPEARQMLQAIANSERPPNQPGTQPAPDTPATIANNFQSCRSFALRAYRECIEGSWTPDAKAGCTSTLDSTLGNCQHYFECGMYKKC